MPRSYQVTPGILRRRRATQPKKVRPTADSMEKSQPAADREHSRPRRTPPPDTPRFSLTWKAAAVVALGAELGGARPVLELDPKLMRAAVPGVAVDPFDSRS